MARMTRRQQQAQDEAELASRLTAEHAQRMAEYDFWTRRKASSTRKVYTWTPALVIGPATELWLKPGSLWRYD